jgi:shikimate dehydrogenase
MPEHRCGVMGWPVAHSVSPAMHNAAYAALGLTDWRYELLPIMPDIAKLAVKEFRDAGFVGINVTVPHKQTVMSACRPDERSRLIGAVNTITLRDLSATNTDVAGLMDDLAAHGIDVAGQRVILLGAGGAARAAVYGLAQAGARVVVVNRTVERAEKLIADLKVDAQALSLQDAVRDKVTLVVNSTSVGMSPNVDESPWPDEIPFPEGAALYDMVYRPRETKLMKSVAARGNRVVDGLGMLVRQGAAAFTIWTGQPAPVDVMYAAAEAALMPS